jgi:hypothetical protein
VVSFDQLALRCGEPAHRLQAWVADLVGEPIAPLQDLSGGAWRARSYPSEADWPPAHSFQEARKFVLRTDRGEWRLKFAGLDGESARKLPRARRLAEAGFAPETVGSRHGFVVERDLAHAVPLDLASYPRAKLIQRTADYLRFRTEAFPARPDDGASLSELLEMARINVGEALGARAAERLFAAADSVGELERRIRRVESDNRLHAWEWLVDADGELVKTDAVDHAHAHDLVGCQDIAWDVAGAIAEFALSLDEAEALRAETGADPELLDLLTPCYLAFQLGSYAMAAEAHGGWPAERDRLAAQRDRYAVALERRLAG